MVDMARLLNCCACASQVAKSSRLLAHLEDNIVKHMGLAHLRFEDTKAVGLGHGVDLTALGEWVTEAHGNTLTWSPHDREKLLLLRLAPV